MRLKRATAILLSLAALAAMPAVPVLRDALPDTAITAEAADTFITQFVDNSVMYIAYRDSSGNAYASAIAGYANLKTLTLKATVTYNGVSYPIRKINTGAFANHANLVTADLSQATNLQEIGENAFYGSTVKYVKINGSSLTIKENAFRNTSQMQNVYVYSGVSKLTIEKNAFYSAAFRDFDCHAKQLVLKQFSMQNSGPFGAASGYNFTVYSEATQATIETGAFAGAWIENLSIYSKKVTIQSQSFIDPNESRAYAKISNLTFGSSTTGITLGSRSIAGLPNLQNIKFNNQSATVSLGTYAFCGTAVKTINLPKTVTTIPTGCFEGCKELTVNPITPYVKTINSGAFRWAKLPKTIDIGKDTTSISNTAFTYTTGIEKFNVVETNPNYKSTDDVLQTKDGKTLLCYPSLKTASGYTATATTIPDGAFNDNKYLKTLSIKNLSRGGSDTVTFYGLSNLETLTIPQVDYNAGAEAILNKFSSLLESTKVHKLNGSEIVVTPSNARPYFNSKFSIYMNNHFEDYEYFYFMKRYVDKTAEYIVKTETDATMTDMQKAVKLHDWIMNNVEYDPLTAEADAQKAQGITPNPAMYTEKNHVDASVFLHVRNGHHYTVCDGYARCYRILLRKAGITAYYVSGSDVVGIPDRRIGHAWNLVKINGNFYHVDVTWDDGNTGTARFSNFMRSDAEFNSDGHSKYSWSVINIGDCNDPIDEITNLNKSHGVAKYSVTMLGDVKKGNGLNNDDVIRLNTIASGSNPTAYEKVAGDLNFDGVVNSADLTMLRDFRSTYNRYYSTVWSWCLSLL